MKTLACTCRNCGKSMSIEVEEQEICSEQFLVGMATCDDCYTARERIEKSNRERFDKLVQREVSRLEKPSKFRQYKQPYND